MELIYLLPPLLLFFSGIPQIIKLLKTKDSTNISLLTHFLTWLAIGIMTIKSFDVQEYVLALSNIISFVLISIKIFLIIRYAKS